MIIKDQKVVQSQKVERPLEALTPAGYETTVTSTVGVD